MADELWRFFQSFQKGLNAAEDSMCTSVNDIHLIVRFVVVSNHKSIRLRMSSTSDGEAASNV
jgi:hypothetical protein